MDISQRDTAINSNEIWKDEGANLKERVISLLRERMSSGGLADYQIMDLLNYDKRNVISGIRNALYKAGNVFELGKIIDPKSGRSVIRWGWSDVKLPRPGLSAKEKLTKIRNVVNSPGDGPASLEYKIHQIKDILKI